MKMNWLILPFKSKLIFEIKFRRSYNPRWQRIGFFKWLRRRRTYVTRTKWVKRRNSGRY